MHDERLQRFWHWKLARVFQHNGGVPPRLDAQLAELERLAALTSTPSVPRPTLESGDLTDWHYFVLSVDGHFDVSFRPSEAWIAVLRERDAASTLRGS
jgi:hypothetical protein